MAQLAPSTAYERHAPNVVAAKLTELNNLLAAHGITAEHPAFGTEVTSEYEAVDRFIQESAALIDRITHECGFKINAAPLWASMNKENDDPSWRAFQLVVQRSEVGQHTTAEEISTFLRVSVVFINTLTRAAHKNGYCLESNGTKGPQEGFRLVLANSK